MSCIAHENTPPKAPRLNGLVERMNCTLIERARCIHSEAKFSNHYWGDEFYSEAHVLNLTPTTTLNYEVQDKT